MRYVSLFYRAHDHYGSPPSHIRDQLDAISSAFCVQINSNLFELCIGSKRWISIGLPGDANHEFQSTSIKQCQFTRLLFLGKVSALDDICSSVLKRDISLADGLARTSKVCGEGFKPSWKRNVLRFLYGFLLSSILFDGHVNDMFISGLLASFLSCQMEEPRQRGDNRFIELPCVPFFKLSSQFNLEVFFIA